MTPTNSSIQAQEPTFTAPSGSLAYTVLDVFSLPQEAQRLLSLALSPAFEIGVLAAEISDHDQPGAGQEGNARYQFINADTTLVLIDSLLSVWPLLLPHVSQDCMEREAARVMRLLNAYQASALTRRRQRRHEEAAAFNVPQQEPEDQPERTGNVLVLLKGRGAS